MCLQLQVRPLQQLWDGAPILNSCRSPPQSPPSGATGSPKTTNMRAPWVPQWIALPTSRSRAIRGPDAAATESTRVSVRSLTQSYLLLRQEAYGEPVIRAQARSSDAQRGVTGEQGATFKTRLEEPWIAGWPKRRARHELCWERRRSTCETFEIHAKALGYRNKPDHAK